MEREIFQAREGQSSVLSFYAVGLVEVSRQCATGYPTPHKGILAVLQ